MAARINGGLPLTFGAEVKITADAFVAVAKKVGQVAKKVFGAIVGAFTKPFEALVEKRLEIINNLASQADEQLSAIGYEPKKVPNPDYRLADPFAGESEEYIDSETEVVQSKGLKAKIARQILDSRQSQEG